ncbi:alanine transaminase [Tilletia horrida]|nr:alanine transaminase [Tilletia horrida]
MNTFRDPRGWAVNTALEHKVKSPKSDTLRRPSVGKEGEAGPTSPFSPAAASLGSPSTQSGSLDQSAAASSSNGNVRTRTNILANANAALAEGTHRAYVLAASGSPPPPGTPSSTLGGYSAAASPAVAHLHHTGNTSSAGPSPVVPHFSRGRSVSTITSTSSIGGSIGHGSMTHLQGHANGSPVPAQYSEGLGLGLPFSPRSESNFPHRRFSSGRAPSASSLSPSDMHASRSRSRSPSSRQRVPSAGDHPYSDSKWSVSTSAIKAGGHRLSLPDTEPRALRKSSSSQSLPRSNAVSPIRSPRQLSSSSIEQHTAYIASLAPMTSGQLPHFRSPFLNDSATRLQPIPATAPPSEDGGSSDDEAENANMQVKKVTQRSSQRLHADFNQSAADPTSDSPQDILGQAVGDNGAGGRRMGSDSTVGRSSGRTYTHGVDRTSSGGESAGRSLPRSPTSQLDAAEADTSKKSRKLKNQALSEKLKRRSKRISGLSVSSPRSVSTNNAEDSRRMGKQRAVSSPTDQAYESDSGDDARSTGHNSLNTDNADADESDMGADESLHAVDLNGEEPQEMSGQGERLQKRNPNSPPKSSTFRTSANRASITLNSKRASATNSTLDFGAALDNDGTGRSGHDSMSTQSSSSFSRRQSSTPSSPLLLPSSPTIGPIENTVANGIFSARSTGVLQSRTGSGRDSISPGPSSDGTASKTPSRKGTSSSTTPRMALAVLGPDTASTSARLSVSPQTVQAVGRSAQGRTTPVDAITALTTKGQPTAGMQSPGSAAGLLDDEEAFFDADDGALRAAGSPAARDAALNSPRQVLRRNISSASNSSISVTSFDYSSTSRSSRDDESVTGSYDGSFYRQGMLSSGTSDQHDPVKSLAEPADLPTTTISLSNPSRLLNASIAESDDVNLDTDADRGVDRRRFWNRDGDPTSTATLRQEFLQAVRDSGLTEDESSTALKTAPTDPIHSAPDADAGSSARPRTGSVLLVTQETSPPRPAPLKPHSGKKLDHPSFMQSPATPETPVSASFMAPMHISTSMPSPDLQLVEPKTFDLKPITEEAYQQAMAAGRPRGSTIGTFSQSYNVVPPARVGAATSTLPPLEQSPRSTRVRSNVLEEEGDANELALPHGRSGSSGTAVESSISSHNPGEVRSASGQVDSPLVSGGVSDQTTTTHSYSANSMAPTDVSGSDTSVSVHEADHSPDHFANVRDAVMGGRSGKGVDTMAQPGPSGPEPSHERASSMGNGLKNRTRARSLGMGAYSSPTTTAPENRIPTGATAYAASSSASSNRSRSGSVTSLHRQVQSSLRSPASFVIAVVGHKNAGKSTVIRRGLKQYGLSRPNMLSEKVTSYSTVCLVDHAERTIEVLEIDAAVLLGGPTKRFAWPKSLPNVDAVILCYDASEVSSFRSMSELLENFSVHNVRTVMLACKSDMEPKALNPYYASEMAAMYNVGLAECTYRTEEGRKRMRNCFSYHVKGVAKDRAMQEAGTDGLRSGSRFGASEGEGSSGETSGSYPSQKAARAAGLVNTLRARGTSVSNSRFSVNRTPSTVIQENAESETCAMAREDSSHVCTYQCGTSRLGTYARDVEASMLSNSEDEGSDQRHRSMLRNVQLGLQSANSVGVYVNVEELYDRFFHSAVSNQDPSFAVTFMIFYRGFAKPIELLMQTITRFEVLSDQEKTDEQVIRYSLIRMVTMLRDWVQEYPGDLSAPDTYFVLMNFYQRLLNHRHCSGIVRAAESAFNAVATAVDLDAAWSKAEDSHKPSSVAADVPPISQYPGVPKDVSIAVHPSESVFGGSSSQGGSTMSLKSSADVPLGAEGRPRADSGSVIGSPVSLADSSPAGGPTEAGRLTARHPSGRDRSSSTATSASYDRQPSLASNDSNPSIPSASTLNVTADSDGSTMGTSNDRDAKISSRGRARAPSDSIMKQSEEARAAQQTDQGVHERLRMASDAILHMEDAKIAQELTEIAWSIFLNIKPRDLLRHALVHVSQRSDGPCMREIRHFNYVSAWVVNMILAQSKLKNRSRLLEKFRIIAGIVRDMNDYATLYCIIGALESQAIYRLEATRAAVEDKPSTKHFASLKMLMSPTKSYSAYRLAIQNPEGRLIPYLGVIYQDLVSISAGNPSKREKDGAVHWRKFELMNEDVTFFAACQQYNGPTGKSDPSIQRHILNLPISPIEDEQLHSSAAAPASMSPSSNAAHGSSSSGTSSSSPYKKVLSKDTINPNVQNVEYAVRGELSNRANEYSDILANGDDNKKKDLPFESVVTANIGNPQQQPNLAQKPITFWRQIASLTEYPALLDDEVLPESVRSKIFPKDAQSRAKALLDDLGSVGAYSHSKGAVTVRKHVAEFIEERDGYPSDPELIYLTSGASGGVALLMQVLIAGPETGILIPIPQYPLYSATLSLYNAHQVEYDLDEKNDWELDIQSMAKAVDEARSKQIDVRALVVINPGNPTGNCLSEDNIRDVLRLAHEKRLVVLADEVYQVNIYQPLERPFVSFKKVLRSFAKSEKPEERVIADDVELISFHSISKGVSGECGRRGGYFELCNISPEVEAQVYKLASVSLCSSIQGQIGIDLLVRPPKEGEESYALYKEETDGIYQTLKSRSEKMQAKFNELPGVVCNEAQGALYLFPRLRLPVEVEQKAKEAGKKIDEYYCLAMLDATGICVVPGSGFGRAPEKAGSSDKDGGKEDDVFCFFRTTTLAKETDAFLDRYGTFHRDFLKKHGRD